MRAVVEKSEKVLVTAHARGMPPRSVVDVRVSKDIVTDNNPACTTIGFQLTKSQITQLIRALKAQRSRLS